VIVASNDALFVHPDVRNGLTSGRLIKAAEAEAQRRGAHKFTWHCRAGTPLADMLTRHGYEPVDVVVARSL
jgi:GNAT superfamily N-acetyltransferase